MFRRNAGESMPRRRNAERGFKLALPLTVEGPDIDGCLFKEQTTLSYISHAAALFPLKSRVSVGSRLKLALALPPKLSEGRDLRLVVKGTIAFIDSAQRNGSESRVSLRLENRYVVETGAS